MRKKGGEFKAPEKLREEIRKMEYSFCYKHGTEKKCESPDRSQTHEIPFRDPDFFCPTLMTNWIFKLSSIAGVAW